MEEFCAKWQPQVLSILRIVTGLLFLEHGTGKYLDFPHLPQVPPTWSMAGVSGMLELAGGILMVIGLFSRPVAFLLSGNMAIAYFYAHQPRAFFPMLNAGEPAILFSFIFLYLFFAGPGPWSLDAMMKRK
jgi:putative oxidoreductase